MGLLVSAAFVESFSGDTTLIPFNFIEGFQNSSVSKVTGYGLRDRSSIPVRSWDFSLRHHVQTDS
jgi:hypothetical protein